MVVRGADQSRLGPTIHHPYPTKRNRSRGPLNRTGRGRLSRCKSRPLQRASLGTGSALRHQPGKYL